MKIVIPNFNTSLFDAERVLVFKFVLQALMSLLVSVFCNNYNYIAVACSLENKISWCHSALEPQCPKNSASSS